MDKEEAERLSRAIRKVRMEWIEVQGVEYNIKTSAFEVRCAYKQEQKERFPVRDYWTTLLISNPRQWITLLSQRGGGLEQS